MKHCGQSLYLMHKKHAVFGVNVITKAGETDKPSAPRCTGEH